MGSSIDLSKLNLLPNSSSAATDSLLKTQGIPGPNGSITWQRNITSVTLDAYDFIELEQLTFKYSSITARICKQAIMEDKTAHVLAQEYRHLKGFGRSTLYTYYAPLLAAKKRRQTSPMD